MAISAPRAANVRVCADSSLSDPVTRQPFCISICASPDMLEPPMPVASLK